MPDVPKSEVAEERAEQFGTCEGCGGPLNEHGLSPYMAEAEELEPVERDDETDQHAKTEDLHAAAFADAIKRGGR